MKRLAAFISVLLLAGLTAFAQTGDSGGEEGGTEDNGFILNLLQEKLSTSGRQIRLSGVSGALSSKADVELITIADQDGVWLRVENAEIDWSRRALLRKRIEISLLSAERIAVLRRPTPAPPEPGLPAVEARPFSIPELPVSVQLEALRIDALEIAEPVFGEAADLEVAGSLSLVGGTLDTELAIVRQDPPGGSLEVAVSFSNETRQLALDVALQEPSGGLTATLLDIEGEPAIDLSLNGEGPLSDLDIDFALDADETRIAGGAAKLRSTDEGLRFDADLTGGLAPLLPAQYRDFFAGESALRVSGVNKEQGGVRVETLALDGAVLKLDGSLETGEDGFLRSLAVSGSLGKSGGEPVVLPVPGGSTRLESARLSVVYGDASRWSGLLALDRLETGDIAMESVTLEMGGLARNLDDPATREVTINLEGLASGISAENPDVAAALGDRIDFFADAALPPGAPIEVRQLQISGNGLSIFTAGTITDFVYTGRNAIRAADISPLSGLAGRTLGGALDLRARGSLSPLSGGFDLTLDGTATDLDLGDPRLAALLAGETKLAGRVVRDEAGIRTEGLELENPQLSFASTGIISSAETDIGFDARLDDLALLDDRLAGALTAKGTATGAGGPIAVALEAAVPEGKLMDRSLSDARVSFEGTVEGADVVGTLGGSGELDTLAMALDGDLRMSETARALEDLLLEIGPNRLTGSITQSLTDEAAPLSGTLTLDAPDIASLAALALVDATGAIDAEIALEPASTGQGVRLKGTARDVAAVGARIGAFDIEAEVTDALGVPLVQGTLDGRDLAVAGIDVDTLSARADQRDGNATDFSAEAALALGTDVALAGNLVRLPGGLAVTLETLRLTQQQVNAELQAPSTVTLEGGVVTLTPLELALGNGSLTAAGRIDENFDLSLTLEEVPLDLANAVKPELALAGQVDGTARVTGPRSAPDVAFDLRAADLAAVATRRAGLPPISVEATGTTADGRLTLDAGIASGDGLDARATGSVPLGTGALDLEIDLQALPLVLIDPLAGNRGLTGEVTGTASVGGTLAAPEAQFEIDGTGISAQVLRTNGIAALRLNAEGSFSENTLVLDAAELSNPTGLDLTASGTVPLAGAGLDVRVEGSVPLALAGAVLAKRDAQATGRLAIDARITGALDDPNVSGSVSLAGGTLVDPRTNVRLEDISLDAVLRGQTVEIDSFRADVAAGGSIAAEGSVSLRAGYPADISMRLNDVRYTDGARVATRVSGDLALDGPITGGGTLSGNLVLDETEISVNEALGGDAQAALDQVIHKLPPRRVQQTLQRAEVGEPEPEAPSPGSSLNVDIGISAPNRIFVRGRGLDVELGGSLRLRGTLDDLQPVGRFELRRGRLAILGQRIEFDQGSLQLIGNLTPQVNFIARTVSGDVTAIVTVEGPVSEPRITFSSEPRLPQDEVLARVIFNRSTDELSAFQLAQLAAAAAELTGRGGNGLFSQVREAAGLDDLDIITEDNGSTAVRAGKYIGDNVYLDLQAGTDGTTRAQVNLDVTDEVTARGSVATDGNTSLGLFYERDY